jgi:hypothetical protein
LRSFSRWLRLDVGAVGRQHQMVPHLSNIRPVGERHDLAECRSDPHEAPWEFRCVCHR